MSYDGYCRLFPVIPEITTKEDGYCGQHSFGSIWQAAKALLKKVWG